MSLDVYLTEPGGTRPQGSGIFIRRNGRNEEITRDQWDRLHPDREPVVCMFEDEGGTVFEWNITHNLNTMAGEAGIYQHLWRPDELGIMKASQLIDPLRAGLVLLESDPSRFQQYNPENGWGDYQGLVSFVRAYLAACREHPDADVRVSR